VAEVPASVRALAAERFAGEDLELVLATLAEYGDEAWHREPERVLRDVLLLAAGDPDEVARLIGYAKTDYRDVLYWAEYQGRERR
jgi:hypothetical protein